MTKNNKILDDNLLYLQEWIRLNPNLQNEFTIDQNYLKWQDQKLDISNFYLPQMLYNEQLRDSLTTISANDLFHIIEISLLDDKRLKEQQRIKASPKITQITKEERNGQEFLVIHCDDSKKYRYDTNEMDKTIKDYQEQLNAKGQVSLAELNQAFLISDVEYQNILKKATLTAKEQQQIMEYEKLAQGSLLYDNFLTPSAINFGRTYQNQIITLQLADEQSSTPNEIAAINRYVEKIAKQEKQLENKPISLTLTKGYQQRAGFTNASIIIFLVLLGGIILSIGLLSIS